MSFERKNEKAPKSTDKVVDRPSEKKPKQTAESDRVRAGERAKALEAALGQIDKQFGAGSVMRMGEKETMGIEAISTGALALDIALGVGGVPRGRVVEIFGPESSGKSTLAMHIVAEAQRNGGICAYVDAEHALVELLVVAGDLDGAVGQHLSGEVRHAAVDGARALEHPGLELGHGLL